VAKTKIKLDHEGIGALLAGPGVMRVVEEAAYATAAGVHAVAHDGPVPVDIWVGSTSLKRDKTPRAAVAVQMAHPAGLPLEAKYGHLANAARAAGLKFTRGESKRLLTYITKSGKKRLATQAQIDNWTRGRRKK